MSTFQAGQTLGRYKILRLLGSGAMGDVYLAEDPQIERRLALKTVRVADGRPAEVEDRKRRLLREAKAAGRIVHPHAITLFDAGEADGVLYLAFEFVDGSDLAQRMEQPPPLTLGQVMRIIREASEALDAAHQHGIVHRDIKPSNILIDRGGRVKVADFGIARMAGQATELTMTGSVVGSPHYLSPEQVRGDELDGRTDVFSLGVVLYELLGRRRPFDGETLTTLVYQILHKEPEPIIDLRPGVNPRVDELLRRMMAKDRDVRFRNAAEVAEEVRRIERELPPALLASPANALQQDADATHIMNSDSLALKPPPPPAAGSAGSGGSIGSGGRATTPPPPPLPGGQTGGTRPMPEPPTIAMASAPTLVRPAVGGPGSVTLPPPPPAAPVPPMGMAAPPKKSSANLWIILGLVGVMGLGAVGVVGYWLWTHRPGVVDPKKDPNAVAQTDPASNSTSPTTNPTTNPNSTPANSTPTNPVRPEPTPQRPTQPDPTPTRPQTPVQNPTPTRPAQPEPTRPQPTPTRPPQQEPEPRPTAPEPDRPEPTLRDPPTSPQNPSRMTMASVGADREMDTGTSLIFEITPDDAFLLLREPGESRANSIGRASEYKAGRDGRSYRLPGEGDFALIIRKEGAGDVVILLHAAASRGTTRVRHNFAARSGAGSAAIRVKQGVTLRGDPETARVSVDGTYRGLARDFSGRKFLELTPGLHRIAIEVPGKGNEEFEVQVAPNAAKDRETLRFDIE